MLYYTYCILSRCHHSPVNVYPLLGELAPPVLGVVVRPVLHDLHALPVLGLLRAVLGDHVQLPDLVL